MNEVAVYLPECANSEVKLHDGLCGTKEEQSRENHTNLSTEQIIPIATISLTILIIIVWLSVILINKFKKGKI